jgi:hypothetical protein
MKPAFFIILALAVACASSESSSDPDGSVDSGSGGVGGAGGAGGGLDVLHKRVFVTAATQGANFGGLEGADALCASEALAAGLEGEFRAWLSTIGSPVAGRFTQSSVPYVLVDGTPIAENWEDLTDGSLLAPIDIDAAGQSQGGDVWTGTLPSAEPFEDDDCAGYASNDAGMTGLCGTTRSIGPAWSASQTPSCDTPLRLFCFQQ